MKQSRGLSSNLNRKAPNFHQILQWDYTKSLFNLFWICTISLRATSKAKQWNIAHSTIFFATLLKRTKPRTRLYKYLVVHPGSIFRFKVKRFANAFKSYSELDACHVLPWKVFPSGLKPIFIGNNTHTNTTWGKYYNFMPIMNNNSWLKNLVWWICVEI